MCGGDAMGNIYQPCYKIFIECLRDFRLQSKMTQQELASALGCRQAYISKYEQGQKRLDIIEIRRICNVLGISLVDFIQEFETRLRKEGL